MHSKWKGKPNQRRTAGTVYAAAAKKNIDRSKRLSQEEEMGVISELIRSEADGTISFGDYTLDAKAKLDNFEHQGDLYKVKTYKDITKLERNGMFVYESVPGTTAYHLNAADTGITFSVEGPEDAQVTLELEEETEYEISVDGVSAGKMKTNLGGKLTVSVELGDKPVEVDVRKC